VKPSLQILDDLLPNVYICGDVAEAGTRNPNARAAMRQATIVADNVVSAATGRSPNFIYQPRWAEGVIKLTLGLVRDPEVEKNIH
jgi:apoptosis-inducing factor 2